MHSENTPENFHEAIDPILDLIDQTLGLDEVAVNQRPFKAACKLVEDFIPSIRFGDEPPRSPGKFSEFCNEEWFKNLYLDVEKWYRKRYAERAATSTRDSMAGVTLVASTPFEFRVPIIANQVEVEGESSWLSFPAVLLPDDHIRDWVHNPPHWETFPKDIVKKADKDMRDIATLLRRISCRMVGASLNDEVVKNILAGVRIHLRSAAVLIANEGQEGSFARAQWELQMACESAYKGYLQQKDKNFPKTHDLFRLNEIADLPNAATEHQWIKTLPRWWEAANLRYGLGDHPTIIGIFYWYRQSLKIISGVFENLDGINLTKARLLIQKRPWLEIPPASTGPEVEESNRT